MKSNVRLLVASFAFAPALALSNVGVPNAAAALRWPVQDGRQNRPPATETIAPNIPGVVAGGTKVQIVKEGFRGTEGPIAAPDGTFLFAEMQGDQLTKIDEDGNIPNFRPYGADGIAIDGAGRLYVGSALGVQVFSPQGQHLGTIPTSRPVQSLAFAGTNKKTLYLVGGGIVWTVAMQAQGLMTRAK